MAEDSDGSATLIAHQQLLPQERAVGPVPTTENMAEQRSTSANPPKKRKEIEGLAGQEERSVEIPEAQATKRQRRTDAAALAKDDTSEEVIRDATIADLESKLREKDREIASLKKQENAFRFFLDRWLQDISHPSTETEPDQQVPELEQVRTQTELMIRLMAEAERPQEIHDVSGYRCWTVLPPRVIGVKASNEDIPKTEWEMVLKLHAYILSENLSDALLLSSELASRLPSSDFHQIAAVYKTIYRLARGVETAWDPSERTLILSIRELGHLVRARFGSPPQEVLDNPKYYYYYYSYTAMP